MTELAKVSLATLCIVAVILAIGGTIEVKTKEQYLQKQLLECKVTALRNQLTLLQIQELCKN